jgi:cytochrome c oxidase subunit 2
MGTTLTIEGAQTPATGRLTVAILGLECKPNSADLLTQLLEHVPGVVRAYVNCDTEMAYVEYSPSEVTPSRLVAAVGQSGLAAGEVTVRSAAQGEALPLDGIAGTKHNGHTAQIREDSLLDEHACCGPQGVQGVAGPDVSESAAVLGGAPLDTSRTARAGQERSAGWPFKVRLGLFLAAVVLVLGPALWLIRPMQSLAGEADYSVDMSMTGFTPRNFSIPAGKPVSLQLNNVDSPFHGITNGSLHQFAIDNLAIDVRLDGKQSTVLNLPALEPGTYQFYCNVCCGGKVNPSMQGTLTVGGTEVTGGTDSAEGIAQR